MENKLPVNCPSCGKELRVQRLACSGCNTVVEGAFSLSVLSRLTGDEQVFVQHLIKCSGSLKDLAKEYGVSYPTVRNRLDAVIEHIRALESEL
ncbi:MAG: hypothetical protein QG656_2777 [Candidatus Hydrogenedentes bacterium]|nr:hypothetical protein [Candidatus Hydrogenedentota bacterium]